MHTSASTAGRAGVLRAASFGNMHTLTLLEGKVAGCGWGGLGQLGPLMSSAPPHDAPASRTSADINQQHINSLTVLHLSMPLPVVQVAAGEVHR